MQNQVTFAKYNGFFCSLAKTTEGSGKVLNLRFL